MDNRQSLARTNSANLPQNTYPPNMATTYMPYQNTHLPPIQSYSSHMQQQNQHYLQQQQYPRPELARYQSAPAPAPSADRYNGQMAPPPSMSSLPPNHMLPQPNGQPHQPPQNYSTPPSGAANYQQRLAPAPPRPNLDTNFSQGQDRPPMWTSAEQIPGMTTDVGRDPTRTHVVGSQGRRGILPSAPGRPPVLPNGMNGSPKASAIPVKDDQGKFPCPNCNKTYLHAKHLKRHMLRHTGDRPYMCVLCNDTFSRSDILKRHFQKCSVRRGNPTGASHLSNPAAHLKKSQAAAAKAASTASPSSTSTPTTAGLANAPYTSAAMNSSSIPSTSAAYSDAPSMSYTMANAASGDLQRLPSTQQMQSSAAHGAMNPNNSSAWSMQNARNPVLYHSNSTSPDQFSMPQAPADDKRNVMQAQPHHMSDEWHQMFQTGASDGYMHQMFSYEHPNHDVKKEYDGPEGGANAYYVSSTTLGADGLPQRATK